MNDERESRAERNIRQAREIEDNQRALRESIAESQRLVEESEKMLQRHRHERDEAGDKH